MPPRKVRHTSWKDLPTEKVHPAARRLDRLPPLQVLRLIAEEDRRLVSAVHAEASRIARGAREMAGVLRRGGRVFFIGAGTSGRLGVIEAAECPPTFGTSPEQIEAIMAGGHRAVFRAQEGAEDRGTEARRALGKRNLGPEDLVVGISASSVTPFVREGLAYARSSGAGTILITSGPRARGVARVVIAPRVSPEIIAGSTRLKSGTATKMILNAMTTLAMKELGKLYGPYMVDLQPSSAKLKDRARRIVAAIVGVDEREAGDLLRRAKGDVKTAIVMGKRGATLRQTRRLLKEAHGDVREALARR